MRRRGKIRPIPSGVGGSTGDTAGAPKERTEASDEEADGRTGGVPLSGEPSGCQARTAGCEAGPEGSRRREVSGRLDTGPHRRVG